MKNCSVRARSSNTTRKKDYYKVCFCHHPSGSSPFSEAIYNTPSRSECKLPLSAAKFKNIRSFHGGCRCPYANVYFVPTLSFILPFHMMDPSHSTDYIFSWPHRVPAVQHDCAEDDGKLPLPVHRRTRGRQSWQAVALQGSQCKCTPVQLLAVLKDTEESVSHHRHPHPHPHPERKRKALVVLVLKRSLLTSFPRSRLPFIASLQTL